MKKWLIGGGIALLIAVSYLLGVGYFSDMFLPNTTFAGQDIGTLTLDEAEARLNEKAYYDKIDLQESGVPQATISYEDIIHVDYGSLLTLVYNQQDPTNWLYESLKGTHSKTRVKDVGHISKEELVAYLGTVIDNSGRKESVDAYINYTEELGYYVEESQQGNEIDLDELAQFIIDERPILVNTDAFYKKPTVTSDDAKIKSIMEHIEQVLSSSITYDFTDYTETIPRSKIEEWIEFDAQNNIQLNYEKVTGYLWALNDTYGTRQKPRQFQTTNKGVVTIQPQIYGWEFDVETEYTQLSQELLQGQTLTREPNIVGRVVVDTLGTNDIGGNYVEIDLAGQHMYVYKNHQLALETPVVTGMPPIMETIPGAWHVLYKELDATLTGYNPHYDREYATPVNYWVPFDNGGMGIHDANWQSTFGGSVYQTAGSNGCINTPPGVMAQVFELVGEGMPVLIY